MAPTLINGGQVRLCSSAEDTPQNGPVHYNCTSISPRIKLSRYRSMFSNSMSPLTPSFGILPLESNTPEPTVPPSHTTLMEANDQKSLAKRVSSLRAHVGVSIIFQLYNKSLFIFRIAFLLSYNLSHGNLIYFRIIFFSN